MRALYDSSSRSCDDLGIKELLSKETKIKSWLKVEAALAKAQAEVGMIPSFAAENIAANSRLERIDLNEMDRITEEIGHGFVPFIKVLVKACDPEAGKYVHYGVTTQNIQQTAQLYVMKNINVLYKRLIGSILDNLAHLANRHAHTVMAGRTHGRHAIPITFGYKVSVWISELLSGVERLEESEKRVFQVMMGGAVGAFNAMPEKGREVQGRVAQQLGMQEMAVPSRNINSHKQEYMINLAMICNVLHKIAEEVYYTGIEEFQELFESFKGGTVGSSTMPHKINPKLAKGMVANAQKLYSLLSLGFFSNVRLFEGDSSSYMLFDGMLEEALALTTEVLIRAVALTDNLHVDAERMYHNVMINQGLDNAENVMMNIAKVIGKDQAHELLYETSMAVEQDNRDFLSLLLEDPLLIEHFSAQELKAMIQPENYTGLSSELAKEQAKQAQQAAKRLLRGSLDDFFALSND